MIVYNTIGVKTPAIKKREVNQWIKNVVDLYNKKVGDIAYIFCSDDEILRINNEYLAHDYYTDIITFDYSEDNIISGDLFISLDTVKTNAEKYNTEYEQELFRVIIHGILHLCGLKDKTPEDQSKMRDSENRALDLLIKNK